MYLIMLSKGGGMMFFVSLFAVLILVSGAGIFYLYTRLRKFKFIKELGTKGKIIAWVLPTAITFLLVLILRMSMFNAIIIFLHLVVFWGICDLVGFAVKKLSKKQFRRYYAGISAVVITIAVLGSGWFLAHNVVETEYSFSTEKDLGRDKLRIVQITDLHLGTTLDGEDFAEELKNIQQTNPDMVVVTGDFVDDDTVKEDMLVACKALGELETELGVYFVYGNHDEGYFRGRDFSLQELRRALDENGITVMEDETLLIDNSVYLIGRKDRSDRDRDDMETLVAGLDRSKYMIVLDHQPNDYDAQAATEVDLVLSGHTHGGHIFPAGPVGVMIGSNDSYYGVETRDKTTFVVSSGISGWAIKFKTGTVSEYVVIDVNMQ